MLRRKLDQTINLIGIGNIANQASVLTPICTNCLIIGHYSGFITSYKEDLSVKRHLAVTNVSNHWYLFTQWNMIKHFNALVLHALRSTLYPCKK